MELATDVIYLVLLSVNDYLFIYIFATGVYCKIRYVGSTELKNISNISARIPYTINFSVEETWMLRLKTWMFSHLEVRKYLT